MSEAKIQKEITKLLNQSGEYTTQAYKESSKGNYDKAGEYRSKAISCSVKARNLERKLSNR